MPLSVYEQYACRGVKLVQVFAYSKLFRTSRRPIFGFQFWLESGSRLYPFHMIVNRISRWFAGPRQLNKLPREADCPLDAGADVVALFEIDVLEKISANGPRGNRISVHLDALQMGNG